MKLVKRSAAHNVAGSGCVKNTTPRKGFPQAPDSLNDLAWSRWEKDRIEAEGALTIEVRIININLTAQLS